MRMHADRRCLLLVLDAVYSAPVCTANLSCAWLFLLASFRYKPPDGAFGKNET